MMNIENQSPVDKVRAELKARKLPRWVLVTGILIGAALLLLLARAVFFGSDDSLQYATIELAQRDLSITVSATGNLQPTRQVEVGSEVSGIVTQVYVDNNDRVYKGQALARLDTARLLDSLTQARASLANARAQLASSEAGVAQANAQLDRLERVRKLSGGEVPSGTEMDQALANYQQAVAQVAASRASIREVQARVSSAQTSLGFATIYSPVNGIVLDRKIEPGQTVAAQFQTPELFSIAEDLSVMRLDVDIDEADIARITKGQRASFTVDAFPGRTFPARVEHVDIGANAGSTAGTVDASKSEVVSYVARLSVQNADMLLRPGMTAVATIAAQDYRNVFVVALPALRFSPPEADTATKLSVRPPDQGADAKQQVRVGAGSQQTLYVLGKDGKPKALQVRIVAVARNEAAVSGPGLKAGQRIITGLLGPSNAQ
jgi:HlyD family secretion protein